MGFEWVEQKNKYNVPEWWCHVPCNVPFEQAMIASKIYYDGFDGWTGIFYNLTQEDSECSQTHFSDREEAQAWCEFTMQTFLDFNDLYGD